MNVTLNPSDVSTRTAPTAGCKINKLADTPGLASVMTRTVLAVVLRVVSKAKTHPVSGGIYNLERKPQIRPCANCPGRRSTHTCINTSPSYSAFCFPFNIITPEISHFKPPWSVAPREGKILAAAWNGDTCSLALATAAGGVKIYDLLPTTPCNSTLDASGDSDSGSRVRPQSGRIRPARPQPVKLILRHEIVIKCVSLIPNGGKKIVHRRVSSLATDESSEPGRQAGSAILVGVAEGQHLCVWDLVTGTTLLTALAIAPAGCKVEKVVWLGPAALTALLYSVEGGLRRIDVHQIDVAGQTATPVRA